MERISKSQKKRDCLSLQALGEQLAALSVEQLARMDLPPDLHAAVLLVKKISKHGPRLRQMQYIGTLMRKCDPKPVQEALERIKQGRAAVER